MTCSPPKCTLVSGGSSIPQSELPVSGGVLVPLRERYHPAPQPRPLNDEVGQGGDGHVCGVVGVDVVFNGWS